MNLPQFVTFTGADDHTSIDGMAELSALYPIEWGILFSRKQQGTGRYPSMKFIESLLTTHSELVFSAHLCGAISRELVAFGELEDVTLERLLFTYFTRAQVNTADPTVQSRVIRDWAKLVDVSPILQCRGGFPLDLNVEWLFDASGGRGIEPAKWPFATYSSMCGYAGGLNPRNVAAAVAQIAIVAQGSRYWIDMESGVRDIDDRFDLSRCRAVCEAVYGKRG